VAPDLVEEAPQTWLSAHLHEQQKSTIQQVSSVRGGIEQLSNLKDMAIGASEKLYLDFVFCLKEDIYIFTLLVGEKLCRVMQYNII